jgi:hypothetical protein
MGRQAVFLEHSLALSLGWALFHPAIIADIVQEYARPGNDSTASGPSNYVAMFDTNRLCWKRHYRVGVFFAVTSPRLMYIICAKRRG